MFTAKSPWKLLFLFWIAQTACCALGLWWNAQLVRSFERRAVLERGWRQLADTEEGPTIYLNANWQPIDFESTALSADAKSCTWIACEHESVSSMRRGILYLEGKEHIALAEPHAQGGYKVQYAPIASFATATASLSRHLQAAGVITLLLVSGLLGLVAYLITGRSYERFAGQQAAAEVQALDQISTLQRTRDGIIFGLAKLAEFRDEDTGCHLERISAFATHLAAALQRHPTGQMQISREFVRMIGVSAVLHDIGKVAISDAILLKPGPLTPDERSTMQQHTLIGASCIAQIERRLGNSNYLRVAREIAQSHHERWDGSGYPDGLRCNQIPLAARIVAIVDVYDALSSRRVYKPPMSHDDCVEVIRSEAGGHFDPLLVEVFLSIAAEMREVAATYHSDMPEPMPPPAPLPRWNLARENEELVDAGDVPDTPFWIGNAT